MSGEAATRTFVVREAMTWKSPIEIVNLDDRSGQPEKGSWWPVSLWRPFQIFHRTALHTGPLVIKIPTLGTLGLAKFMTLRHKGPRLFWLEGLCFTRPPFWKFLKLIFNEPFLSFGRAIVNTRAMGRLALREHDRFAVSSATQREEILSLAPRCEVHVIENTVADLFARVPIPAGRQGPFRLGYLGHGYLVKGVREFLEALTLLQRHQIPFSAHFAFSDLASARLARRARACGYRVSGTVDKTAFFQELDLLVAPFWADWGTNQFPNVLLESLSFGVPVLTTDLPATRDLFGDPSLARFVPEPTPEALALALEAILRNPEALPDPRGLRSLYLTRYSPARISQRWESVLSGLGETEG